MRKPETNKHVFLEGVAVEQIVQRMLVDDYGYSKNQILKNFSIQTEKERIRPDFVVFKSEKKVRPLLVVEVKSRIKYYSMPWEILRRYKEIGAEFFVLTDGFEKICYKLVNNKPVELPDIPISGKSTVQITRNVLKPFSNLSHKFWEIFDLMRSQYQVYDYMAEINKLLLCKILDEKRIDEKLRFVVEDVDVKNINKISNEIKSLFEDAKNEYPTVYNENDEILLSPEVITQIVLSLQSYSLLKTNPDLMKSFYDDLLRKNLRQYSGECLTPGWLVEFIIQLVSPKTNESLLDPSCGLGNFVIESMRYVWKNIERKNRDLTIAQEIKEKYVEKIFGVDRNVNSIVSTKILFLLNGDGHSNIFQGDFLRGYLPEKIQNKIDGGFDLIIGKSPMGGLIERDKKTESLKLFSNKSKRKFESVFIERCVNSLKEGGRMAIIIPEGVLFSTSLRNLRNYISKNSTIKAIISLPNGAFLEYGMSIKTNILILEKKNVDKKNIDYDIFLAELKIKNHKYNVQITPDETGDIQRLLESYKEFSCTSKPTKLKFDNIKLLKFSELGQNWTVSRYFSSPSQEMDFMDYRPEFRGASNRLDYSVKKLDQISNVTSGLKVSSKLYSNEKMDDNISYVRISDLQNGTVDVKNGKYIPKVGGSLYSKSIIKTGDVLFSRQATIGKTAVVPSSITNAVASSQLAIIRAKSNIIDPDYLNLILSSNSFKKKISRFISGTFIRYLSIRDLKGIEIRIPSVETQKEIVKKIKRLKDRQKKLETERKQLQGLIEFTIGGGSS